MCGRFTLRTPLTLVARQLGLFDVPTIVPHDDIRPTNNVLAVRTPGVGLARELVSLRWGLVPGWADDLKIGSRMINARGETVASKPSFRTALRKRRCLILADGFYEWETLGKRKERRLFELAEGGVFGFAGLWDRWAKEATPVETCTIITTSANALLAPIHDRMPVILPSEDYDAWLDPRIEQPEVLEPMLRPCPLGMLVQRE